MTSMANDVFHRDLNSKYSQKLGRRKAFQSIKNKNILLKHLILTIICLDLTQWSRKDKKREARQAYRKANRILVAGAMTRLCVSKFAWYLGSPVL